MEWNKINLDEVGYCFKSTKSTLDFSCLPTQTEQILQIIGVFYYYDNKNFTEEDIRQMFEKLQVISPRSGKVILPTVKKIGTILEKMVEAGELGREDIYFKIPDSYKENGMFYARELQRGKEQGYLDGWIEYVKKNRKM